MIYGLRVLIAYHEDKLCNYFADLLYVVVIKLNSPIPIIYC